MNINEILENIQNLKEKSTIELKKASSELPKSFWETYSSFANTKGGYIILGIDNRKKAILSRELLIRKKLKQICGI